MKLKTSLLYNGFISIIQSVNSGAEGGFCQTKQSQLPPAGASDLTQGTSFYLSAKFFLEIYYLYEDTSSPFSIGARPSSFSSKRIIMIMACYSSPVAMVTRSVREELVLTVLVYSQLYQSQTKTTTETKAICGSSVTLHVADDGLGC